MKLALTWSILATLATTANGLYRAVNEVLFICNPVDYTKVMPAIMKQQPDGTWINRFPHPTKLIQSTYVPTNKAIIGLGKRYFLD